ncbi:hypothetical protein [Altererythrobacter sp. GH1-8]|uniref:hypothetical protein n=1 Tax=Altererythrobacter sp. GH1-8 TaxID=3349333 RepID=UPI00374D85C1
MRRQILALLALLTGLAAIGTPAHASVAEALSCEIGASALEQHGTQQERQACEDDNVHAPTKGPAEADPPARKTKRVIRPPVLFGIDRAYE